MKKPSRLKHLAPVALALAVLAVIAARAGGPLYVGGPGMAEGVPFVWATINPVTYWTDQGSLGTLNNTAANNLVADAFQAWQDVPTATISFSRQGQLSADVTALNITPVMDALGDCSTLPNDPAGGIAKPRTIVYDSDGSILQALGEDPSSILGFATALCFTTDGVNNNFNRGFALINGQFVTGSSSTTLVKAVMTHEFGHLIGLDHSQINLNCLTSYCAPGSDDLEGVPTMFPVLIDEEAMSTLAADDKAAISALYPETVDNAPDHVPFASTTGRITGHVLFSDGQTPAQGFNVIARSTTAPLVTAVSCVSGFLYTVDVGNPVYPWWGDAYGSRDPALIGYYNLPGLPPGDYTVEVEAIHNSEPIPFVDGSSLGPIGTYGFQFPLPSLLPTPPPCTPEYWVSGATATCNSTAATTVPIAGGSVVTGTDVILIATAPRYDAWEDAGP
jgi:uncharacterized protein YuzB (UPF0349 family)